MISRPSRSAIVTGATSGIGEAIAEQLSRQHYNLMLTGRRQDRLQALQGRLGGDGQVASLVADVNQPGTFSTLYRQACASFGSRPDAAVLCAGKGLAGTLLGSDPGQWQDLFATNVLAMMHQMRECAEQFVADAQADPRVRDIVVIGSTIGRQVSAFNPVYGATKFALHSLVEGLRQEICDKYIRVTLIEPGFVVTEFQRNAGYDMDWFEQQQQQFGPFLSGKDVAEAVAFTLSLPSHVHVDDLRIRPTRQRV